MKRCLHTSLLLLALFISPGLSVAGEALIQLDVFSMTKVRATRLLSDERLVTNPSAVLKDLGEMKDRNEAKLVAVPSLQGALPFRTRVTGKVSAEVDVAENSDGTIHLNISVQTGTRESASSLNTAFAAQKDTPKFLGTLEPRDPAEQDHTWVVFLHTHPK